MGRDPARPALATDTLGTHYFLTRDFSMMDQAGDLERYSYKDAIAMADQSSMPILLLYRRQTPRYQPHIIGQVYNHTLIYNDNPLYGEVNLVIF
jgi:hypothetical protein